MTTALAEIRARERARRLYPRSKGYQNTYMRGYRAHANGRPSDACPYPPDPAKTWRIAWRKAWLSGWSSYENGGSS